jgi:small subunit ribosomal protein S6
LAQTVFEGMFILDSNRYGRDPAAVSGRISRIIEQAGGEMLVSRLWEERRLAYSVKGHRKGTYWLTYFRVDGPQLAGIRRQFQLNEDVLRFLFLKVDPRIVDAIVEHARTATVVSAPEGGGEKPARSAAPKGEPSEEAAVEAPAADKTDEADK